jgi:chromosome segregation ATPase
MTDNGTNWKEKFSSLVQTCQEELKKTTEIGKRMISASKTNSQMREAHEELGTLVRKAIIDKSVSWTSPRVEQLLEQIQKCEAEIESIEKDVQAIKKNHSDNH